MSTFREETNEVVIRGEFVTELRFNHSSHGGEFYTAELLVERLSDQIDVLPIMISDKLLDVKEDYRCERVEIVGQLRSYHNRERGKNHVKLVVFVKDIRFLSKMNDYRKLNAIYLEGYLCRAPKYRRTFQGKEISDIIIAVKREYGKEDYIPCICWGSTARNVREVGPGEYVQLWGRIQSREYLKRVHENELVSKVAYEVSVNRMYYGTRILKSGC